MNVIEIKANKPSIGEVLAFMRAGAAPDTHLISVSESAMERVWGVTRARACFVRLPVLLLGDGKIKIGSLEIKSKSLENRLSDCSEAYIFAVTVGSEVDRIIRAESARSSLSGLCADASGSAAVESAADALNEEIDAVIKREGKKTKVRFSAGYGDLPVEFQKDICALLDTKKNIGVALGDGGMMTPTKSVTAIIGVY